VLLVLERIRGPDLYDYVTEHSADAEIYKRFQLMLDVACALRYLHSQIPQIVHGDLKGSNVLVEATIPRAKLVDFGLSRLLTKEATPLGGSLAWMAPELLIPPRSKPQAGADVFSFGRLAYMILTCRKPLEGMNSTAIREMARAHLTHNLVWDEGRPLQKECAALSQEMMRFVPAERPDMKKVHEEISKWVLPDLEEKMPALELARSMPTASSWTGLAGAMQLLRSTISTAILLPAQRQDRAPGGLAGGAVGAAVAGQGGKQAGQGDQPQPELPMVLPERSPTRTAMKVLMLEEVMRQWNWPAKPDACCKYHAAVAELHRVGQVMMERNSCQSDFLPYGMFQCRRCGVLDYVYRSACPMCDMSSQGTAVLSSMRQPALEPAGPSQSAPNLCSL